MSVLLAIWKAQLGSLLEAGYRPIFDPDCGFRISKSFIQRSHPTDP